MVPPEPGPDLLEAEHAIPIAANTAKATTGDARSP
jgi:hypothetical protein